MGGQAGDAVEQGANTAADKAEEAGSAAEDYSKTGQKQVTAHIDGTFEATMLQSFRSKDVHQHDSVPNACGSSCLLQLPKDGLWNLLLVFLQAKSAGRKAGKTAKSTADSAADKTEQAGQKAADAGAQFRHALWHAGDLAAAVQIWVALLSM